jgi:hypothetical protein
MRGYLSAMIKHGSMTRFCADRTGRSVGAVRLLIEAKPT